jgi:hypothetical protein
MNHNPDQAHTEATSSHLSAPDVFRIEKPSTLMHSEQMDLPPPNSVDDTVAANDDLSHIVETHLWDDPAQ